MGEAADARAGAEILAESAGVHAFEDLSLLDVSGEDTRSWLNGQLTNDVRNTAEGDAVYALAVTVKGKILGDVWVFDRGGDRFWLAVSRECVPALLESFDAQIIMEDVEVEEVKDLGVASVAGPAAADVVASVDGLEGRVFPTHRLMAGGRDVIIDRADENVIAALVAGAESHGGGAVDRRAWDLARLRRAAPRYPIDFDHRNYPQEAGLKARAVSFEKGCYLGQEVVCMLETRGKLSKRLVVLTLETISGKTAPKADASIASEEGQEIGRVTSSAIDGETTLAFGYVKAAFAETGNALQVEGRRAEVTAIVE